MTLRSFALDIKAMESEACLVVAAVFKTVERLLWSLVGSIPSLSAIAMTSGNDSSEVSCSVY